MSSEANDTSTGTITANGQSIYYEIHGNGPPLVLVMGIGYDATLWGLHQIPALSRHYRVIAFDNRDAGRSSRAHEAYTIADMADDIAGLLDALGIERAHVLGISMGGMIAQEFAIRHPDRLDRLIMTGTGAAPARVKFDPVATWDFVKSQNDDGAVFAAQQLSWLFSDDFLRNHEAVDQTLEMLAANEHPLDAGAFHRQAKAYLQHDALDRLDQIAAPTLVVAGERDRLTPPWTCREVAAGIPDARFRLIDGPGSSHVLPLERPEEFNALVLGFLGERA